jgi:pyridoxal phosphate enzyme (YggS family)
MPLDSAEADRRLSSIKSRIAEALAKSGRGPEEATLLAVSKTFPAQDVEIFHKCGQLAFGESYVQEAREKIPSLPPDVVWHFIGHLQSNKAKVAADLFSVVHALDSLDLALQLDKRLETAEKTMQVYVQVNVSGEDSKSGLRPEDLARFLDALAPLKRLAVQGLMTMPPYDPDPESSRPHFASLRELRDRVCPHLKGLSMGMSDDFPVALSEGATIVRVGSALFGRRRRP